MANAKQRAWTIALQSKQRARERQEKHLADQRRDLASHHATIHRHGEIMNDARGSLRNCEQDIADGLTRRVTIELHLQHQAYRDNLHDELQKLNTEHEQLLTQATEKNQAIADTCRQIAKLDAQIDMCQKQITKLVREADQWQTDMEDEAAGEAIQAMKSRRAFG